MRNGAHEWFEYDGEGRLLRHWLPSFTGQTHSVSYTYYADGHPWEDLKWTETNPEGHTTTYEYDRLFVNGAPSADACAGRGLVTKVTHHDGTYRLFSYNIYGNKQWETNELGQLTWYDYDGYGRVVSVRDPLDRVATKSYSVPGNSMAVSTVTSPSTRSTEFRRDANLRTIEEIVRAPGTSATLPVYKIESLNSGKVLDVEGVSVDNGAWLHQWSYWGGSNQSRKKGSNLNVCGRRQNSLTTNIQV